MRPTLGQRKLCWKTRGAPLTKTVAYPEAATAAGEVPLFWKTEKIILDYPGISGYVRIVPLNWLPTGKSTEIFMAMGEAASEMRLGSEEFTMGQASRVMGSFAPFLPDVVANWQITVQSEDGEPEQTLAPADLGRPTEQEKRDFVAGLPFGITQRIFETVMEGMGEPDEEGNRSTVPLQSASN